MIRMLNQRLHLFEFEDQPWFPKNIRNYMTDYLQALANTLRFYEAIIPVLRKGLAHTDTKQIVDLASGGGGGWLSLAGKIQAELPGVKILLTDFYPNTDAFAETHAKHPDLFDYTTESVDATNVPSTLKGLRTQFLSFHHFTPEQARRILQNAVDARQPIAIFEAAQRDLKNLLMINSIPASVLALTPFIKPFSLDRLVYTYLVPAVPFFIGFDGIVSVFRMYSPEELRELIASLDNGESFEWEIDTVRRGPITVSYLLGYPKK